MNDPAFLLMLYALAMLVLIAEIFIPSHGVLTVVGLGVLIGAIVKTFSIYGDAVGGLAVLASLVVIPTLAVVAVRMWPNTRIGRLIAPPNPVYTKKDFGTGPEELQPLIGQVGRTLSPLRPVGTCEFGRQRLECISESGMVEADVKVRAVGVRGRNLEVAAIDGPSTTPEKTT
ncbi:MAG: hypothetical protein V3W34_03730 [Phycisphaerae bacterium]